MHKICRFAFLSTVFLFFSGSVLAHNNNLWQSLQFKNSLVFAKGVATTKLAVITSLDCSHCRMLEYELSKLDNVTIYKFLTPIQGGYSQSVSIWCAADRNKAYTQVMLHRQNPRMTSCANPMSNNLAWFYKNKLLGVPIIISPKGVKYGYASKEELMKWLN